LLRIYCLPGGTSNGVTNVGADVVAVESVPPWGCPARASRSRKNDSTLAFTASAPLGRVRDVPTSA